jgi:hypothetical protein
MINLSGRVGQEVLVLYTEIDSICQSLLADNEGREELVLYSQFRIASGRELAQPSESQIHIYSDF